MAFRGKVLLNPLTGQDIIFLQTSKDTEGRLLKMQSVYNTQSREPIAHYHPEQEEDFTVLEGELSVKINGQLTAYKAGEHFYIPKGTVHSMWNASVGKTIVNWEVRPAMNTEYLLETTAGLANDGRTGADGKPGLLQIALIANRYAGVFRLAKPPYIVQRILFTLLSPFARLAGYKASYREYLD
ncbi:MAG: cupin domain-containing protein [Niastella sp.]|nr:cupin domain-containing protein [Niastella sp.]